jgi:hypothetical protein
MVPPLPGETAVPRAIDRRKLFGTIRETSLDHRVHGPTRIAVPGACCDIAITSRLLLRTRMERPRQRAHTQRPRSHERGS